MADLKTDYVDDVLDTDVNETRIFNIVDSDGNVVAENIHFVDNTTYTTTGDSYGATEINEQNEAINQLNADLNDYLPLSGGTMTGRIYMGSGSSNDTPGIFFPTVDYGSHMIDGYNGSFRYYNGTTGADILMGYKKLSVNGVNLYDICQKVAGITTSTISFTATTSGTTPTSYSVSGTKSGYTPIAISPPIHHHGGHVTVAVETLSMSSGKVDVTGYYSNIKDSTSRSTTVEFIVTWLKN